MVADNPNYRIPDQLGTEPHHCNLCERFVLVRVPGANLKRCGNVRLMTKQEQLAWVAKAEAPSCLAIRGRQKVATRCDGYRYSPPKPPPKPDRTALVVGAAISFAVSAVAACLWWLLP